MYSIITAVPMCLTAKAYCKMVFKCEKFGSHKFSWQSLLISTTVLNNVSGQRQATIVC